MVAGGPELGEGTVAERSRVLRDVHDSFRSAVINEPRGSDGLVGALVCEPSDPSCSIGAIFFHNVGYFGMCVHGTIGLVASLHYIGNISPGVHRIETPVGVVSAELHDSGAVTVTNVPSYRYTKNVAVVVEGFGTVRGDVAWGGNWFFLVETNGMELMLENRDFLVDYTWRIRQALAKNGITGSNQEEIDNIELFTHSHNPTADSKNFVLLPGRTYDRSPCGTGTSAKLACLYMDGKLAEGQIWRQESIVGSIFEGSILVEGNQIYPQIKSTAFINAEGYLILSERDPFRCGISERTVKATSLYAASS